MTSIRAMFTRRVLSASVTPLSSIFGSGFLIIVPVLERALGTLSVVGITGVCVLAWLIGTVTRHNVRAVERLDDEQPRDRVTSRIDDASDVVIVVAYIISIALYLRIMAQYVIDFVSPGSIVAERALATAAVLVIVGVGVARGFSGLDRLERLALAAVLVLTTVLGVALFFHDVSEVLAGSVRLPPVPANGLVEVLLVLSGIVITVQGFETVRYLGHEYDEDTRVWASRLAQIVATSIYIGFVAVATPVMGLGTEAGPDRTLLDITGRVVAFLSLPLVITAVLSQFSAATADTVAAHGNLQRLTPRLMRGPRSFVASGATAIALIWVVSTFPLIAIASRAFAAYYAVESVVAMRTCDRRLHQVGFGALAVVLTLITLLAQPAG